MSSVLIDNLSIGNIADRMNTWSNGYDTYIKNYLYALILWDDIYAINARHSIRVGKKEEAILFDDELKINRLSYDYSYLEALSGDIEYEYWMEKSGILDNIDICEDAIFYLLLGHNLGMNILLSDERTRFIKKSGISNKIFSRVDILEMLDKEVLEYYKEVNALIDKEIFTLKMPVLLDYISSNAKNFEEAKELALRIKYDQEVIEFRKAMDLMDDALNSGNLVEFKNYIDVIPEIVNKITHSRFETKTLDVGISISPSVTIPFCLEKLHLKKKIINMNFLFDLARYGIKKEKVEFRP